MINKKYSSILFGALMALIMTFFMSCIITYMNIGLTSNFITMWLNSFLTGFVVALPTAVLAAPLCQKITDKMTK